MEINLKPLIKQISKEKDLDELVIKEAIEQAIISASKKNLAMYHTARPQMDMESGNLKIFVTKTVVNEVKNERLEIFVKKARQIQKRIKVGQQVEVEIDPTEFGRIAAQSARQGILQRLRDAERDKIFNEYEGRVGTLVTGVVQRFVRNTIIVNIGKAEGILIMSEVPKSAKYRFGDRIKVFIYEVKKSTKGPQILLSRARPELVIKLFEQEVPEISDNIVKVVAIAREAGFRTKIAVISMNPDVDPVGACVGMKGSRVQMIVRELENEKIDIVPYSANPATFITNALNPAEIVQINLDEGKKTAEVVVKQSSLSIAIGKKGLNTRLASRLTGWRIDLKGDESLKVSKEVEEIRMRYLEDLLTQIEDLPSIAREGIYKSQYNSVEKLASLEPKALYGFTNDNHELAVKIIEGAKEYLEALQEIQTKTMEEAAEEGDEQKEEEPSGEEESNENKEEKNEVAELVEKQEKTTNSEEQENKNTDQQMEN